MIRAKATLTRAIHLIIHKIEVKGGVTEDVRVYDS